MTDFDIVDFHAHVLPSVDHGSDSLETSLYQLSLARESGVGRVVATPHFYPNEHGVYEFLAKRDTAYQQLCEAISEKGGYPELRLGCEVLFCKGIARLPELDRFCISGTKTLLLELPFSDFSEDYLKDVRELIELGYEVVLAHADRYAADSINLMLSVGAKIQLNADSITGLFIPRRVKEWLSASAVVALGSDIHGRDTVAYKLLVAASRRISKYESVFVESNAIWQRSNKGYLVHQ